MKIWANTIVNNEENFIWFSIMSVIDYVDKVLIYDTGSIDRTVEIINVLLKKYPEKIIFKEVGKVNKYEFTKMRQKMLEESDCDWILVLDGDEIWWKDSIKKLVEKIKNIKQGSIFVPVIVPVGDIYHFQDQSAGKYNIQGKIGNYNVRAISKSIPGLYVDLPYGSEGYYDNNNNPIQKRVDCSFLNSPYLHLTHLKRSSKKNDKYKYELGEEVKKSFIFPEVLYQKYPLFISSPWTKISGIKKLKAQILTPLRKIKRRIK